jgi:hypothetical protein
MHRPEQTHGIRAGVGSGGGRLRRQIKRAVRTGKENTGTAPPETPLILGRGADRDAAARRQPGHFYRNPVVHQSGVGRDLKAHLPEAVRTRSGAVHSRRAQKD